MTDTSDPADLPAPVEADPAPARKPTLDRRRGTGDGLSSLVGSGGSQVGTNGAMRARDVSRPR
jgi:hypothetical protein